jgi:hypothetical protein
MGDSEAWRLTASHLSGVTCHMPTTAARRPYSFAWQVHGGAQGGPGHPQQPPPQPEGDPRCCRGPEEIGAA